MQTDAALTGACALIFLIRVAQPGWGLRCYLPFVSGSLSGPIKPLLSRQQPMLTLDSLARPTLGHGRLCSVLGCSVRLLFSRSCPATSRPPIPGEPRVY